MKTTRTLGSALLIVTSLPLLAQTPAPPPTVDDVPLTVATDWAQAAVGACAASGYNVTALVMGSDYTLKLVLRADGARGATIDIARRKAYTVIKTGMSSGDYGASVAPPAGTPAPAPTPGQPVGLPPGPGADPNMIIWAGGLPLKIGGKIVAAVSVSGAPGGDKDAACAEAGLARIAGKLPASR